MLPLSYQIPAAVALMAGGVVTCFAGYRLFRFVLGAYGFLLGAMVASSMVGTSGTWAIVVSAIAGGVAGALILTVGYFVGVALVGAGTAVFLLNAIWTPLRGEPHWVLVVVTAVVGAFLAIRFQRYVIVAATAFGGAWTLLVGLAALMAGKAAKAASASTDVWVVYPNAAVLPTSWVYAACAVIGLIGMYVQFHTGGKRKQKRKS
ncbi:MAG: DUF4203 domain-containing protein [Acidobacteria bacterium]|nr:DUF4203 domain-containing protein [Acidobacteriota bacterium]